MNNQYIFICFNLVILAGCADGRYHSSTSLNRTVTQQDSSILAPKYDMPKAALVSSFGLTAQEKKRLIDLADQGNVDACLTLAEHFALLAADYRHAEYYYRKAVEFGGKREKEILSSFLKTL